MKKRVFESMVKKNERMHTQHHQSWLPLNMTIGEIDAKR